MNKKDGERAKLPGSETGAGGLGSSDVGGIRIKGHAALKGASALLFLVPLLLPLLLPLPRQALLRGRALPPPPVKLLQLGAGLPRPLLQVLPARCGGAPGFENIPNKLPTPSSTVFTQ
jgi:hypothetical protein